LISGPSDEKQNAKQAGADFGNTQHCKNPVQFKCYSWHNFDIDFNFIVKKYVFVSPTKLLRAKRWRIGSRSRATSLKIVGSITDVILLFSFNKTFRPHYGPRFDAAANRNRYQEYFLSGIGGRGLWLIILLPSCTDFLEIREPQSPGTHRASQG
jgi:hypothetical protein